MPNATDSTGTEHDSTQRKLWDSGVSRNVRDKLVIRVAASAV